MLFLDKDLVVPPIVADGLRNTALPPSMVGALSSGLAAALGTSGAGGARRRGAARRPMTICGNRQMFRYPVAGRIDVPAVRLVALELMRTLVGGVNVTTAAEAQTAGRVAMASWRPALLPGPTERGALPPQLLLYEPRREPTEEPPPP